MKKVSKKHKQLEIDYIQELAKNDMRAVDALIRNSVKSDVLLVSQVAEHIVKSGGKRLRPLIILIAAKALGYKGTKQINAAAIIEFIHTATLLHDDVVDASDRRRGKNTANNIFGNQASVLVGDFLYSRAFQMMVDINSMRVMNILADATNTIASGEVMQLMNINNPEITEDSYHKVIYRKTARLFEAGAQIAAVLANRNTTIEKAMISYGKNLGIAFQLIDDLFDYGISDEEIGKNLGDDLAEGKPTLPLIYAMQNGSKNERKIISSAIVNGDLQQMEKIKSVIKSTGAIEYTESCAKKASYDAISSLDSMPESQFKEALISIAEFSITRNH